MCRGLILLVFVIQLFTAKAQELMYPPLLIAPAMNDSNIHPKVMLDWDATPGAMQYKIAISEDSLFNTTYQILYTNYSAIDASCLHFNTKYFWRVKAMGINNDSTAWSAAGCFTTIKNITLNIPADSAEKIPLRAYLNWTVISGIDYIEYQLDTSQHFSSPYFVSGMIQGSSYDAFSDELTFGDRYFLRMRSIHSCDTSDWTSLRSFHTSDSVIIPPNATNNYSNQLKCYFKWEWLGASKYELYITEDSLFNSGIVIFIDSCNESSIHDLILHYLGMLPNYYTPNTIFKFNTKYFWKVRACNHKDTSLYSEIRWFKTVNNPVIQLSIPYNNETNVSVETNFSLFCNSSTAVYYVFCSNTYYFLAINEFQLQLDTTDLFINPAEYSIPAILHQNNYQLSLNYPLMSNTDYYWRVRVISVVDTSEYSPANYFRTAGPVGIADYATNQNSFNISPNPSNDGIFQINTNTTGNIIFVISNSQGQVVFSKSLYIAEGDNMYTLNLSMLPNGMYFLNLQNTSGSYTHKIIINK